MGKEIDKCSPKLATACVADPAVGDVRPIPISGDGGAASLSTVDPLPERIEAVSPKGVGLVNGVKWAIVSFVRGLRLL